MQDFFVISPETEDQLLNDINVHQDSFFRFGAGFTDLLMELKKNPSTKPMPNGQNDSSDDNSKLVVINLAKLKDSNFSLIEKKEKSVRIGALVTASEIVRNDDIKALFPVLHKAADSLASSQIRQVATVGGNICTASPAGDIATSLIALNADCEVLASDKSIRNISLKDFLIGVRLTALNKNEILRSISIPICNSSFPYNKIVSDFIKIGTRRSMECSIVSLAYHFELDYEDKILHAGIAIGSSAPTIRFTQSACDYLIGKKFNEFTENEGIAFAEKVLEYAEPISDIRGSAWYRKQVLFNISKSILEF